MVISICPDWKNVSPSRSIDLHMDPTIGMRITLANAKVGPFPPDKTGHPFICFLELGQGRHSFLQRRPAATNRVELENLRSRRSLRVQLRRRSRDRNAG